MSPINVVANVIQESKEKDKNENPVFTTTPVLYYTILLQHLCIRYGTSMVLVHLPSHLHPDPRPLHM